MLVKRDTLPSLAGFDTFHDTFFSYAKESARAALLSPRISKRRLLDAHVAWREDLTRVSEHEPQIEGDLDHFKQRGHLAYWLRRQSPVIEYEDMREMAGEEDDLYPDEKELRSILELYTSEYFAFDFGFQICRFYESERVDKIRSHNPDIDMDYLITVCNFMKFKHVSPHSLFLVYKSLFL